MTAKRTKSKGADKGITRTRDPLGQFPDRLTLEADAGPQDCLDLFRRLARASDPVPRIEALKRHPEMVATTKELAGDLESLAGKANALFHARLAQAEAHAGRLDDRPRVARDEARQAGTRKPKNPAVQDWIDLQVRRGTGETAKELWARAPDEVTDVIGFERFQKRLSKARKDAGIGRK